MSMRRFRKPATGLPITMFRAWYVPLYYYGIIHGDPHLGNYSVRKDHLVSTCWISAASVSSRPAFIGGVHRPLSRLDDER